MWGNTGQIFLAHASEDKETVRQLYHRLVRCGFNPWLDEIDVLPGQNWQLEIPQAIDRSDIVIACISRNSVGKTGYVQKEFRLALNTYAQKPPGSIFLIPVRLDQSEVPDLQIPNLGVRLRDIQWIDLWKDFGFDWLLHAIGQALRDRKSQVRPRTKRDSEGFEQEKTGHLQGEAIPNRPEFIADNKLHRLLASFEITHEPYQDLLKSDLIYFQDAEHGNWGYRLTPRGRVLLDNLNACFTDEQLGYLLDTFQKMNEPNEYLINLGLISYEYEAHGIGRYRLTQHGCHLLDKFNTEPNDGVGLA